MKWIAGLLAALGIGGPQPADVRQWEADTATAMAYAACLQEVAPTPAPTPKPDPGKPAPGKPAPKPAAKPVAKPVVQQSCPGGVCPAPTTYRRVFRRR